MRNNVANTKDDPSIPFVTLSLSGKDYRLCYSFNALAKVEALTGLNMFQGLTLDSLNAIQLRAMLYASLLKAHPDITLDQAGDLIVSPIHCNLVLKAIGDAWAASFPKPDPSDPNVPAGITDPA